MFEVNGKYNEAKIYIDDVDSSTMGQIIALCNMEAFRATQICIMPDVHAGNGCVIGTTINWLEDKVMPNLVGQDIGCGMSVFMLKEHRIDLPKFDSGVNRVAMTSKGLSDEAEQLVNDLLIRKFVNTENVTKSFGTLGGGNHFVELNKMSNGDICMVIHSGSRYLGGIVARTYQDLAYKQNEDGFATGQLFMDYIHDMNIVQQFASLNRQMLGYKIMKESKLHEIDGSFETIHNYIDMEDMILRKGAVSALEGEKLIIPMNMRDGSLICTGKGNIDWNCSAPHGAGRLYSRSDTKDKFSLKEFKEAMKEHKIFTTSVNQGTLDECPMAYKDMQTIIDSIGDTVEINERIIPIYNFKNSTKE